MKMKFFFASLLLGASVSVFAQGFNDGIDFYSIGDYENAKTILDRNINSAANKAEAFYYYGMIDFKNGNFDLQVKTSRRVWLLMPTMLTTTLVWVL